MSGTVAGLNPRARGWLRHLWEKATTEDDWSSSGEPHPWWDRDSSAPFCSFPRFDLGESAYALPLMSNATPAWREVYSRIAQELCERNLTFWAAIDALVLIGEDPNVDRYPPEWLTYMPERVRGAYPPPGWIGNGDERWGLNPDPIASDGNVFFRGFLNLLLSTYAYVSGDTRYHESFQVSGYMDRSFDWTQPELAKFISDQMADRPEGAHCENTKIWPFCISATGLGLTVYDTVNGTKLQEPFDAWTEFAQKHYMGRDRKGNLEWFAFYYDPIVGEACAFPDSLSSLAALVTLPYLYPQRPEWGEWLYEQSVHQLGWSNPKAKLNEFTPDPRAMAIALLMAHELGDDVTEKRLREHVEERFEPRTFGEEDDRFGYFFGWGEQYPRGQQSALMMISEVAAPGDWRRWPNNIDRSRFAAPTVEGVEFPAMGLSSARNDARRGELRIETYAATPSRAGGATKFQVTQIPDVGDVGVICDGEDYPAWRTTGTNEIEIEMSIGDHVVVIRTGYFGPESVRDEAGGAVTAPKNAVSSRQITVPPPAAAAAIAQACRCC